MPCTSPPWNFPIPCNTRRILVLAQIFVVFFFLSRQQIKIFFGFGWVVLISVMTILRRRGRTLSKAPTFFTVSTKLVPHSDSSLSTLEKNFCYLTCLWIFLYGNTATVVGMTPILCLLPPSCRTRNFLCHQGFIGSLRN